MSRDFQFSPQHGSVEDHCIVINIGGLSIDGG